MLFSHATPKTPAPQSFFCKLDFTFIDHYMARLGASATSVWLALKRHASHATQECWPSLARICSLTGLTKNTARKALRVLERAGLISVHARWKGPDARGSNLYHLHNPSDVLRNETIDVIPLPFSLEHVADLGCEANEYEDTTHHQEPVENSVENSVENGTPETVVFPVIDQPLTGGDAKIAPELDPENQIQEEKEKEIFPGSISGEGEKGIGKSTEPCDDENHRHFSPGRDLMLCLTCFRSWTKEKTDGTQNTRTTDRRDTTSEGLQGLRQENPLGD